MTPLFSQRPRADRQFERLYRHHAGDVYRYALAVLRNPADAEDVTQTTFLNAYRAFSNGDRPQTPRNWLIAIAHNVCRQRFRQAARRPSEVQLNEDLAEAFVPEETIAVEDIQRALGHLAFNQRAALVMRELEGRSYAEIGEILEVSVAAVETLIFRARRALREQLEGALTCSDAEHAISRQLDGVLPRQEKAQLRGHLRECRSCSSIARRMRAQKGAWKALAVIPLPGSLTSLFGGSGATAATGAGLLGGGVAIKAAAVVATAAVATGTVYEGKKLVVAPSSKEAAPALGSAVAPSGRSAKTLAPGQVKPDGQRALKSAVPPGRAKARPTTAKPKPETLVGKALAPGQVKKTVTAASSPIATRGTSEAAPGHAVSAAKKKPAVKPRPKRPPKKVDPSPAKEKAKPAQASAAAQKDKPAQGTPAVESTPDTGNGNGSGNNAGGNVNGDAGGNGNGVDNPKK